MACPSTLRKDSYTFNGWCQDINGNGIVYQANQTILIGNSDIVFFAQWKRNQCTVTFNTQGGSPNPSPVKVDIGSSMGSTFPQVTKNAYTLDVWKNASGATVSSSTTINQDMTITAYWVIRDVSGNTYTEMTVGKHVWMKEPLKATAGVSHIEAESDWWATSNAAYCIEGNFTVYNWYAAARANIVPSGWHVATVSDWQEYVNLGYQCEQTWISGTAKWDDNQRWSGPGYATIFGWALDQGTSTLRTGCPSTEITVEAVSRNNGYSIYCVRDY